MNAVRREVVMNSYNTAKAEHHLRFLEGDSKTPENFIYDNQKEDAAGNWSYPNKLLVL